MDSMHLIADIECVDLLDYADNVESFMGHCILATNLTIRHFHIEEFTGESEFGPGITGIAVLSESHMVVHTAPERQMLNLDLFSCKPFDSELIMNEVIVHFGHMETKRWEIIER